jgi:hypothetical protein
VKPIKPPTHAVVIPVSFTGREGNKKTKWYEVGAAWDNGNGKMNFNLVYQPGISFQIVPNKQINTQKGE